MEVSNDTGSSPVLTTKSKDDMWKTKKPRNSQQQIIDFLQTVECATETQIQQEVWSYYRNQSKRPWLGGHSSESNKKYADILRRALYSGKIDRMKIQFHGKDNRKYWYYFIPKQQNTL